MDNMKEKISKVREFSPSSRKDDIIQVLHHFDGDVEKSIEAYKRDGAQAILSQWNVPNRRGKGTGGSNQKSKNKKKKHKGGVDTDIISDEPTVPNNNNNVEKPTHTRIENIGQANGHVPTNNNNKPKDITVQPQPRREPNRPRREESAPKTTQEKTGSGHSPKREPRNSPKQNNVPNQRGGGGKSSTHQNSAPPKKSGETDRSKQVEQHKRGQQTGGKQSGRRRNISTSSDKGGKGDRVRTISEVSSTSQDTGKPKNPAAVLERVSKDLQRTQVSLSRHTILLNEEFDKSEKRLRKAFEDGRHSLEQRENEMLRQLKEVKRQATLLLENRNVRAADLKLGTARAASMSEQQLSELRADIKHFVSERKVDEEIGRTMRFTWNPDPLEKAIKSTGEVIPIQTTYTPTPSITSDASGGALSRTVSVVSSESGQFSRSTSQMDSSVPQTPTSPDMDMKTEVENFAARLQRSLDSRGGPRRPRNDRSRSQGRPAGKRDQQGNQGQKSQETGKEKGRPDRTDDVEKSQKGRRNRGGEQGRQKSGEQGRPNRDQGRDNRRKDIQNKKEANRERLSSSSSTGKGEESPDGSPKKSRSMRRREQYRRRHTPNKDESDVKDETEAKPAKTEANPVVTEAKPVETEAKPVEARSPKSENKDSPSEPIDSKDASDEPLVNGATEPVPEESVPEVKVEHDKDSSPKPERPNELDIVPNGPKLTQNDVLENHIEEDAVVEKTDIKCKLIPNGVIHDGKDNLENGESNETPLTNGNKSSDGESSPVTENGEDALPQRKPRERKERSEKMAEKVISEAVKEVSAMNGVVVAAAEEEEVGGEEIAVEH